VSYPVIHFHADSNPLDLLARVEDSAFTIMYTANGITHTFEGLYVTNYDMWLEFWPWDEQSGQYNQKRRRLIGLEDIKILEFA
jgi:hypothetical protein